MRARAFWLTAKASTGSKCCSSILAVRSGATRIVSSRPVDKAAKPKGALAYERDHARRERERAREEAARRKDRERRQQAIDKAQVALAS